MSDVQSATVDSTVTATGRDGGAVRRDDAERRAERCRDSPALRGAPAANLIASHASPLVPVSTPPLVPASTSLLVPRPLAAKPVPVAIEEEVRLDEAVEDERGGELVPRGAMASPRPPPPGGAGARVQRTSLPELFVAMVTPDRDEAGGLLVEDGAQTLTSGQMRKGDFMRQLRTEVCRVAEEELRRAGRSAAGCPYIDQMLAHYEGRTAEHLERAIRRYAPETRRLRDARDYLPVLSARLGRGIARWVTTGQMPEDVPNEALAALAGARTGIVGAIAGIAGISRKAAAGPEPATVDAGALIRRLGPGQALDGGTQSRMERALGHSFAGVRIHADDHAAALSHDLAARAFTIGPHVAFAPGELRPGTPHGDALLAHELAHVIQQGTAAPTGDVPVGAAADPLEHDADLAAAAAVEQLHGEPNPLHRRPRWNATNGGLRLQRCRTTPPVMPTRPVPASPTTASTAAETNPVTRYEKGGPEIPPLDPAQTRADVIANLKQISDAGNITSWSTPGLKEGSTEERYVLYTIARLALKARWGSEVDVIAEVGPGTRGAITVRIDTAGNAVGTVVESSVPTVAATYSNANDAKAGLKATYHLTAVREEGGTKWTVAKLNKVAAAWSRLSAAEASALKGYELVLTKELTVDGESVQGVTTSEDFPKKDNPTTLVHIRKIEYTDSLFDGDMTGFIGDKGDAAPASFEILLHEPAHAIATRRFDAAHAKEAQALVDDNKAVEAANTAQRATNQAIKKAKAAGFRKIDLIAAQPLFTAILDAQKKLQAAQNAGDGKAVSTALAAANSAELAARDTLAAAIPASNKAGATLKKVITVQDAYVKAIQKLIDTHNANEAAIKESQSFMVGKNPKPVQAFVELVTQKKIDPPTDYAKKHWPEKPTEFYAEAFSLWKNDPTFLGRYSAELKQWFDDGNHLE